MDRKTKTHTKELTTKGLFDSTVSFLVLYLVLDLYHSLDYLSQCNLAKDTELPVRRNASQPKNSKFDSDSESKSKSSASKTNSRVIATKPNHGTFPKEGAINPFGLHGSKAASMQSKIDSAFECAAMECFYVEEYFELELEFDGIALHFFSKKSEEPIKIKIK